MKKKIFENINQNIKSKFYSKNFEGDTTFVTIFKARGSLTYGLHIEIKRNLDILFYESLKKNFNQSLENQLKLKFIDN